MSIIDRSDVVDGVEYSCFGSDCFGDWHILARAIFYKKGSSKSQLKRKFRFISSTGGIIDHVERIENIKENKQ
ncbi:hypothetical protein OAA60_06055 [Porticoccaceae bacterium]|nr:hypothetical protein [Porticoccaceae bacterium]